MWKHTTLILSLSHKITTSTSDCCQPCCQETQWELPPPLQFPALFLVKITSGYGCYTCWSWNQKYALVLDAWLPQDRGKVRSVLATLCPMPLLPSLLIGRVCPPAFCYPVAGYIIRCLACQHCFPLASSLAGERRSGQKTLANRKTARVFWSHSLDWGMSVSEFHTE